MSNEIVVALCALVSVCLIFCAAWRGREWLLVSIAVNLILANLLGDTLISIFGFITNTGSIFYACVFLATHFLIERFGKAAGIEALFVGVGTMLSFILLSQFAMLFSVVGIGGVEGQLPALPNLVPRVFVASILAYIFAQYTNILLYDWFNRSMLGKWLWLRSNAANSISQLIDSSLFFTIAFFDLSGFLLIQGILVGWMLKSAVVLLGTPLLYFYANQKTSTKQAV